MPYSSKDDTIQQRQLEVQEVCIPVAITGNATAASVLPRNDEPSRLFIQTEGVNQITAALASGETATYTTTAPDDSDGIFRFFLQIKEPVGKVCSAYFFLRNTGVQVPVSLGSATGISTGSGGGKSIMLSADSAVDLSAANLDGCLVVKYVVNEN